MHIDNVTTSVTLTFTGDEVRHLKNIASFDVSVPEIVGSGSADVRAKTRFLGDLHDALRNAGV